MDRPNSAPDCPECGRPMAVRIARRGRNAGQQFWGCTGFPSCTGIVNIDGGGIDAIASASPVISEQADLPNSAPDCPECGRSMAIRSARRGRNAGQQFWGCTGYPRCRGIVNIGGGGSRLSAKEVSGGDGAPEEAGLIFPRNVSVPPASGQQTKFFQACALPAGYVQCVHDNDLDAAPIRAAAQWRLDFPLPKEPARERLATVLSVAEALLMRGTTPYCSPYLEQQLRTTGGKPDPADLLEAFKAVAYNPSSRYSPADLDSREEEKLADEIADLIVDEDLGWQLTPQIRLASLSGRFEDSAEQRGDLLLSHPEEGSVLVEIDGQDHAGHQQRDLDRDETLEAAGIHVLRIPAKEVRDGDGAALKELFEILRAAPARQDLPSDKLVLAIRLSKFAHQIEVAVLEAIRGGWLEFDQPWTIQILLPTDLAGSKKAHGIARSAVTDLHQLLNHVTELYGESNKLPLPDVTIVEAYGDQSDGIVIAPFDRKDAGGQAPAFLVSDACLPVNIAAPLSAAQPVSIQDPSREAARWFLQYLFRKDEFWEGQWECVERVLKGQDSVVLLPTGGGKSIAFQLGALLLPGRCIVVDPIISLIDDQIDNLSRAGIDRCIGITSQIQSARQREQAYRSLSQGHYLFCYVAPERFQMTPFRDALRALTVIAPISVIAIDEAHCVSEWGHDFRTAYLNLGRISREYCASHNRTPPLVALTGTASKIVLKDVQRELGITDFGSVITPKSFDRPELVFTVLKCDSSEKAHRVQGFVSRMPSDFAVSADSFYLPRGEDTNSGLVFCPHVNGDYGVVEQAQQLSRVLSVPVEVYSGSAPNNVSDRTWNERKRDVARRFKRNRTPILACTKAFGMGIDKPNIRYSVHIGLPQSIESFYQEAGRTGRDRKTAHCGLVLSNDDPRRSEHLLSPGTPISEVAQVVEETDRADADDILRSLWFHVRSFRGQQQDLSDLEAVLDELGDLSKRSLVRLVWGESSPDGEDGKGWMEKALHRLVVMGVVEDYTVDYSAREFSVRLTGATKEDIARKSGEYAGSYRRALGEKMEREILAAEEPSQPREFVLFVADKLIRFIYEHIELARRRSLNEMLAAAANASTGEDLRQRVLQYLEYSEFDERLNDFLSSEVGGLDELTHVIDELVSPADAVSLRGSVASLLASYPDIPGLLLIRALTEAFAPDADSVVVSQNVDAAVRFALEKYEIDKEVVADACAQIVRALTHTPERASDVMRAVLGSEFTDRTLVRRLVAGVPASLAALPARWLTNRLASEASMMRSVA